MLCFNADIENTFPDDALQKSEGGMNSMKSFILDFLRRGTFSCGIGPIVLAILYLILNLSGTLTTLTVAEICIGIFSLSALAFIAGGMNAIYQIERLPLVLAIFIHGLVLYLSYLLTYLINNWLDSGIIPLIVFTAIFIVGFLVIWAIIYLVVKRSTCKLNKMLEKNATRSE